MQERRIDLPRAIVWDALIDPVLVEGWLHPTVRLLDGVVERVDPVPGETAVLATSLTTGAQPFGELRFELDELPGGTRGTFTLLRLGGAGAANVSAWLERLDHLENLLRGHPVDWGAAPRSYEQNRPQMLQ